MRQQRLNDLIEQWLDDVIVESDLNELKEELRSNQASLEHYVDLAQIHSLLAQGQTAAVPSNNVVSMERIVRRQKRRNVKWALTAAAAVIVIALVTMRLFFIEDMAQPLLTFQSSPGAQFSLTHSGQDEAPEGQVFAVGSRLQLSQGALELNFQSGVKSIVLAPADLTLHDQDSLFLNKGKAWFKVPPSAIGFKVKTKDLNIVDLGTEFGVIADEIKHDELHVFSGKVEVTALRVRKESATLVAGEARRIDPVGRLSDIPVHPHHFSTNLPDTLPYLHWSFDEVDGDQLLVEGNHPETHGLVSTLKSRKGGGNLVSGKKGKALSLDGQGSYVITNWPGFEGGRPRTVSFWMKLPEPRLEVDRSSIICWGDTWRGFARWQLMVKRRHKGDLDSKAQLTFGFAHDEGTHDVSQLLKYGQWHHITVSYSGQPDKQGNYQEQVYIDGEFVELMPSKFRKQPVDTSITGKGAKPLSIGVTMRGNQKRHFLKGVIDELYIYEGYMTESQVKRLQQEQFSHKQSLQK